MSKTAADSVLQALDLGRATLEKAADHWAAVLEGAAILVFVGVVIEFVATIIDVRHERRAGHAIRLHHVMTFVGAGLVAGALAVECWAEYKAASKQTDLRSINAQVESHLSEKANQATADAVGIAEQFGGLHAYVDKKEVEFAQLAEAEKAKNDKVIAQLNRDRLILDKARADALNSAGTAASAANGARTAAEDMKATLASEERMRDGMRALLTPRVMTDAQVQDLVVKLTPFAGTPFDLMMAEDSDAIPLAQVLGGALQKAGWIWKDAQFSLGFTHKFGDTPQVGSVPTMGLTADIAESARSSLSAPVVALANSLHDEGINLTPEAVPDDKMNKVFDKSIVHIFVGTRAASIH